MRKRLSVEQMGIGVRLVLWGPAFVLVGAFSLTDGHPILGSLLMLLGALSFAISFYRLRENERASKGDR